MEKEKVFLNVVSRCCVSLLYDGRVAIMHETERGDECPAIVALVEADEEQVGRAVLDALQVAAGMAQMDEKEDSL